MSKEKFDMTVVNEQIKQEIEITELQGDKPILFSKCGKQITKQITNEPDNNEDEYEFLEFFKIARKTGISSAK